MSHSGRLSPASGGPAIQVDDVWLDYRLSHANAGSFKEFLVQLMTRKVTVEKFHALRGISFQVEPGEVLGIIGDNGAGKSTLMKLLAGVLPPSRGRVRVRGRVAPMIELGAGFNPELTGEENVLLYASLLGRDPARTRERIGAIAEWAELTPFIDVPLRTYSSGMQARLAFAVAVDVQPDVLLVDEVLSVGDAAFREKSAARINHLIGNGATVVLVSHDLEQMTSRPDRVLWLEQGSLRAAGPPGDVVGAYRAARTTR